MYCDIEWWGKVQVARGTAINSKKDENIDRGWSTYLGPIPLLNYL
jgi:hypothetical protein